MHFHMMLFLPYKWSGYRKRGGVEFEGGTISLHDVFGSFDGLSAVLESTLPWFCLSYKIGGLILLTCICPDQFFVAILCPDFIS